MADIPATWRNIAVGFSNIVEGDRISVEVEGGWMGVVVPLSGRVIFTKGGDEIFVPESLVKEMGSEKCIVESCSNRRSDGEFMGSICRPCWLFASGRDGGERSQAYRNAVAAGKRRRSTQ